VKIAEGVPARLSVGKRRPDRDSFDPPFATYAEFPNSFSQCTPEGYHQDLTKSTCQGAPSVSTLRNPSASVLSPSGIRDDDIPLGFFSTPTYLPTLTVVLTR
jgi:hypothetical protein